MCGIFGIVESDGCGVKKEDLDRLASKQIHRGPDDHGTFTDRNFAIGMRRLAIIDLEGGAQPISNEDGSVQLVMNGEVYNYKELRKNLVAKGHIFKTNSDVEVVVHLYEQYGRECVQYLNGMFAFALLDRKKNELWLVRDRLGIKPLFYCQLGNRFAFSSELTGLARIFDQSISEKALFQYLGFSYVPAPLTIFRNIFKLSAGQELILSRGKIQTKNYWGIEQPMGSNVNLENSLEELDALLMDSVKAQMVSDVPLGVFLSGGVDSSAIAYYAAKARGSDKLETFNINFDGKGGEDSKYALQFSELINSRHLVSEVDAEEQFNALEDVIKYMDEPMSDSAIVPTYMLSKIARENGIKVLLSGAGGDEVFGGYPRHFPGAFGSASWFASLPYPLRMSASFLLGLRNPAHRDRISHPSHNFAISISGANFAFLKDCLNKTSVVNDLLLQYRQIFSEVNKDGSYPLMRMDLANYLPNNVLSLTDKATMGASVEGRVPLLDHRIVEYALSLPEEMNLYKGKQKGLFKKVLNKKLPDSILERSKEGFNAPIHKWVEKWPTRIHDEVVSSAAQVLEDIFNIKKVENWLYNPIKRNRAGVSLYAIFVLSRWYKRHISAEI